MNHYNRNGFQNARSYGGNQQQRNPGDFEGKGKLWQNLKSQHPKAPQFTGSCTIGGVEYYISAWFGHDPSRGETISLKIEPKQQQRRQQYEQQTGGQRGYAAPQPQQRYEAQNNRGYIQQGPNAYNQGPQQVGYSQPENAPQQPPVNGPEDYGYSGRDPFDDEMPF